MSMNGITQSRKEHTMLDVINIGGIDYGMR